MLWKIILRLIALFWIIVLVSGTLEYLSFKPDTDFLKLKQHAVQTGWYLPAFYSHIFGSGVILLTGFFQFSRMIYSNRPLHKFLGKIYIIGVLFFAAPGAYIMSIFINRGHGVFLSFITQNTLWIIFTIYAWTTIKQGKIQQHINLMRRSYALAFAAITLRFYIWLFAVLGNGVKFDNNYLIIAFLSWVPNLLLVEVINYYDKKHAPSIL